MRKEREYSDIYDLARQERRPLTQAQRRQLSARRVLDAATALVAEVGVARTTLADISRRAGYSHGIVRVRFGSKSGLMTVLARDIRERFVSNVLLPAIGDKTGLEAIEACAQASLRSLFSDDSLGPSFFAIAGEAIAADRELQPGVAWVWWSYRERFEGYVAEGIEAGTIRPDTSPKRAALFIVGAIFGVAMEYLMDRDRVELDDMLDGILTFLHRSLAVQ